ncbi:TBP-associated factor, putative [Candida dubliniensis CD36]|uniref:Transcription initiation factor TFIID subunit 8 n=1 Tax=Candida dubliniensis (strain CD36 / ATCC MYA-646 / CBS 7987 / NCPF 3949 / NRRL Y-17841) TaxID=573826 RepID=B9WCX4_CANDC|nr:TBP-associated factor, putative [Candida dubliniensis CD36]CAX44249.1 TBP-associated factor, putative [Candida dubliniensis CD36]
MDTVLESIVGTLLETRNYTFTEQFLDQLTELTLQYINELSADLSKYTRIQRRQQPSISDIKLLLKLKHISTNELIQEIELSKKFTYRKQLTSLLDSLVEEPINEQSRPFFDQSSITELVPRLNVKPSYIPSYLPDLPPDYTYQSTPEYMETLTDLKKLRMKLVEESRMTETSLYKLIEYDDIEWRQKFEQELAELDPNTSVNDTTNLPIATTDAKTKNSEDFKFDIVEYARMRKQLQIKRHRNLETKRKTREENIFMKAEMYYSPYSTIEPTPEVKKYFEDVLSDGFKNVIMSVRNTEKLKEQKLKRQIEENARREQELQKQNESISFNFPAINQSESESESEQEEKELNFDASDNERESRNLVVVQSSDGKALQQLNPPLSEDVSDISSDDMDIVA